MTADLMHIRKMGALVSMLVTLNAQALDTAELMNELSWKKRVVLVFAPGSQDSGLQQQEAELATDRAGMSERDMTVIRVLADGGMSVDGVRHDDTAASYYQRFGIHRDEFKVVLVGKDGGVKLERDSPVTTTELFSLIDSMPMRRDEMQ